MPTIKNTSTIVTTKLFKIVNLILLYFVNTVLFYILKNTNNYSNLYNIINVLL